MNIYKLEFNMHFKSVLVWSLSVSAAIFFIMALFPTFSSDADMLNDIMANFPEEFLMAFGMNGVDLSTVLGFFGTYFLFFQVALAVQAANYGFALVSVEEADMTADFLLTKPVTRTTILTNKLSSAGSSLAVTMLIVWLSSFVFVEMYRNGRLYQTSTLLLLLLTIPFLQLFFLTVSLFISLLVKRVRSVTPFSMGLVFGLYVLNAFASMIGGDGLAIISPFKHFEPNYIVAHNALDIPMVLISVAAILISVVGSYALYIKKDIHSAS